MRVLVTSASKYGATAEIARRIADVLTTSGHDVDLKPAESTDVTGYDALVIGSAVYAGHWLPAAKTLADRLAAELTKRPVWLFSSGPVGEPPKPEEDPVDVAEIVKATDAREHRVFAGKIDRDLLSFPEKAIVMALRVRSGDFRQWGEIEGWAGEIAAVLGSEA